MKKLAITLTAMILAVSLAACGASGSSSAPSASASSSTSASSSVSGADSASQSGDLTSLMDKLYESIPEDQLPMMMPMEDGSKYMPLTAENSQYTVGVAADKYVQGICSEAAMTAQAHSVALLKAQSPEQAAELAQEIAENANPNKWICVSAERLIVERSGDTVLLIMSYQDLAQSISDNFKTAFGADAVTVVADKVFNDMGEVVNSGMDESAADSAMSASTSAIG